MSVELRRYVGWLLLVLAGATVLGALYGRWEQGLLAGAVLVILIQVRHLFQFDRALRTGDYSTHRPGSEIWSRAFVSLEKLKIRGQKHKRRYRRLLKEVRKSTRAMPDGAIILDGNSRIVICNPAAQKLVGFDSRKDRGQRVDNILRDPRFVAYLEDDQPGEGIEIQSPLRDGDWIYCRIVPYGENQRLLLMRDVTERVRLNKMRRDFVANASHELRSPLTVIGGYLDALAGDPEIPDDWSRPVAQMQAQATRMTSIVSELIELSRLETAGSAPDDVVGVGPILTSVTRGYAELSDTPTVELDVQSQADLRGSASDFESVVTNLVSNAVRHTPSDGKIVVTWSDDGDSALLSVSDTGEGIASEHIPRLTERFFRVDKGRARADGGIGLGLAIVKYALTRHDAELEIMSSVGMGSTFTCRFPADRLLRPAELSAAGVV